MRIIVSITEFIDIVYHCTIVICYCCKMTKTLFQLNAVIYLLQVIYSIQLKHFFKLFILVNTLFFTLFKLFFFQTFIVIKNYELHHNI